MPLDTLLAEREPSFIANTPLQKVASGGGVALRIDQTADVVANAFQTGLFRVHSPTADGSEIQYFDGIWKRVCKCYWDGAPNLLVDTIRAAGADQVTCGDNLHVEGSLTVGGSMQSPFWVSGTFDSGGVLLHSSGRVTCTVTNESTGVYFVQRASAHPAGLSYVISCLSVTARGWGGFGIASYERDTESSFWIVSRASNSNKLSVECTFTVPL